MAVEGVDEIDTKQVCKDCVKEVQTVTLTLDSITKRMQQMARTVSDAERAKKSLARVVSKDAFAAYPDKHDAKKLIRKMTK
mmetsp:Transcript_10350/g.18362  ORF Transcript_10350/g.18362 Transcript_10350/m.18362 type:complete len:81 (+) Transcript_10350:116-358(+)